MFEQKMDDLPVELQKAIYLFNSGEYFDAHRTFGPQKTSYNGREGYRLTVWAPNARDIFVISDFTDWYVGEPLIHIKDTGVWTGFFEGAEESDNYKFRVIQADGTEKLKQDPFAFKYEVRPNDASVIKALPDKDWQDGEWMEAQSEKNIYESPLNIYEVHLSSWKQHENGDWYTIPELQEELIPYAKEMGYTHIQFMPLMEHPLDASWGYQITGFFALSSKYGEIEEMQNFVEAAHQAGLGVIVDWVPSHFNRNDYAMAYFDGTPTFEYADPNRANNNRWGTLNFDLGKAQVHSFLISNAMFWLEVFHLDGIRIDAVSNMLYLDYDDGPWTPNEDGTNENRQGIAMIQKLNTKIFERHPNTLMIAEESTAFPKVTAPVYEGGLGFNFKWNMGWMNDTLKFFEMDPEYRKYHFDLVTFSFMYIWNENFVNAFSHDEVVHGKRSLLHKMPGDYYNQVANLRTVEGYRMTMPGKKLDFMGAEFGQFIEWNFAEELDWLNLNNPVNQKHQHYMTELNKFYLENKSLWELDHKPEGTVIMQADKPEETVLSFIRKSKDPDDFLIIVLNFRPHQYDEFKLGVPYAGTYAEAFNSERSEFGGSWESAQVDKEAQEVEDGLYYDQDYTITVTLPAMSLLVMKPKDIDRTKKPQSQSEETDKKATKSQSKIKSKKESKKS